MQSITQRLMSFAIAAIAVAVLVFAAPKPAEAAPLTTGFATSVNAARTDSVDHVQWRRGYGFRRGYGYRRGFYGRRFYGGPRFYGYGCVLRPRMVATPWGWRRRLVRVCG